VTRDATQFNCPVEATLAVIGGRWKAVILFHLFNEGPLRFSEFKHKIPSISERVLTKQLRELESDGLLVRTVFPEVPLRVEYALSEYGETIKSVADSMCAWGVEHMKRAGRSPN